MNRSVSSTSNSINTCKSNGPSAPPSTEGRSVRLASAPEEEACGPAPRFTRIAASVHPAWEASHAKEPPLCCSSSHAGGMRVRHPPLRAAAHGPRHSPGQCDGGARAPHAPTTVRGHSSRHTPESSELQSAHTAACHGGPSAAAGASLATSHRTGTVSSPPRHLYTLAMASRPPLHAERNNLQGFCRSQPHS